MKRYIYILISVFLLASCSSGIENTGVSPSPGISAAASPVPATVEPADTPNPAFTEVNASWPENMLSPDAVLGSYSYYLDTSKILTDGKETGCMLCRRDASGAGEPLGILSYSIAAFGSHLYFLAWSGTGDNFLMQGDSVNALYRLDDDGGRTLICSGWFLYSVYNALYVHDDTLYFTRFNESAIFKADLDCENIERIPLVLPEEHDPLGYCKKMARGNLFTEIELGYSYDENDLITFIYHIFGEGNGMYFSGNYTMSTDNNNLTKVDSEYCNNNINIGGWIYYLDLENPTWTDEEDYVLYNIHRVKEDGREEANLNIVCSDFVVSDGWIYYLDRENLIGSDEDDKLYNIRRVKQDGTGNENLNIVCFEFEIIDKYIYADTDLEYGDFAYWNTYRYNMDGTGEKLLKYSDMTRYIEDGRLYFTTFDDKVIYIADTSCGSVKKLKVNIPDDEELQGQIGDNYELGFIKVTDFECGWLYFDYNVTDTGSFTYYTGGYRINIKNSKVEKTNEGMFDYPYLGE